MPSPLHRNRGLAAAASLTAIVVAVAACVVPRQGAAASLRSPRPTVVLVHGAWADGSSWAAVALRLRHAGYAVVVPANPLRSLSGDASYIAGVLASIRGPIVLAAHSYGGAVITNAAAHDSQVKGLVYIDAFVPDTGESVLDLAGKFPGSGLPAAITEVPFTQGSQGSGVDVFIKAASFRSVFAADVPVSRAALMAASQRPVALTALTEKSTATAWKSTPSWYLAGRADRAIPLVTQLFMARRAHSHLAEIDASHASLISHPGPVTLLILRAAKAVG